MESYVKQHEGFQTVNKIVEMMGSIPLFDTIAGIQNNIIAEYMEIVELEQGQTLFSEGDNSDYMGFVVSGALDVIKQSDSGKDVTVSTLPRGRSIGEMALVDTFPRSATVVANKPSTLLIMSSENFEQILEKYPRVGISFLKGISKMISLHLRRVSGQLADVS